MRLQILTWLIRVKIVTEKSRTQAIPHSENNFRHLWLCGNNLPVREQG
jgi:hypothetical protein